MLPRGYVLGLVCSGAIVNIKINGVDVKSHYHVATASTSGFANPAVLRGKNNIELTFASIIGQDTEANRLITGPSPDFFCEVVLESQARTIDGNIIRNDPSTSERITLFKLAFDMETGKVVTRDHEFFQPTSFETQHLRSQPGFMNSSPSKMYGNGFEPFDSITLKNDFYIDDILLDHFHWQSGVPMEDTPRLRELLINAYSTLHETISQGRFDLIYPEMAPAWENAAYMIWGERNAERYIKEINSPQRLSRVRPNGEVLQPLEFNVFQLGEDYLEFGANNRLVQILPPPIYWHGNEQIVESRFVFYMPKINNLQLATIVTP